MENISRVTGHALKRLQEAGDKEAYGLPRILTPLIKFRACRDARKVTGDAMEVRGGCGYIEEWADPRLLRDAHLGSIWEGTSNIVALDVNRAMRRENSLELLQAHWHELLAAADPEADLRESIDAAMPRAVALAEAAAGGAESLTRRSASALYHLTTAIAMTWEAARIARPARAHLARLVLRHRLLPADPLGIDAADDRHAIEAALLDA